MYYSSTYKLVYLDDYCCYYQQFCNCKFIAFTYHTDVSKWQVTGSDC